MAEPKENVLMEKIVSLCKRRGFVFQSSEIYGGINGFWDYGPLGAELKRNVKDAWWKTTVHHRDDVVGLEATIIMHPQIWRASGHVDTFADMMRECPLTKKRVRADQVEPQTGIAFTYLGARSTVPTEVVTALRSDLTEAISKLSTEDLKKSAEKEIGDLAQGELSAIKVKVRLFKWSDEAEELHPLRKLLHEFISTYKGKDSTEPFKVLLPIGKPPESARKLAREFYSLCGVENPELLGGEAQKVEDSTDFHPESGVALSDPRPFNLMFKTYVGPVESEDGIAYLRPETAQAIFAQFKNVLDSSRLKTPFGIGQIGKAFRNEVTPRNYTFRSREFEQMELEFFIKPDEAIEAIIGSVTKVPETGHPGEPQPSWGWQAWHRYWIEERVAFYEGIGLSRNTLGFHVQTPEELAHYARACVDILFKFPFSKRDEQGELVGEELEGIAARSDFDLSQHARFSGKTMGVFDEELRTAWGKLAPEKQIELRERYFQARLKYLSKVEKDPAKAAQQAKDDADGLAKGQYIPHVIEPSAGVDRLILALLCHAYSEVTTTDDKGKAETRVVMKFHPRIAPIKVGVFPLLKNKPELVKKAQAVRDLLRPHLTVFYDDAGAIGRRYARQDEAGTPFGITIDFDTLGEKPELLDTVTLRDRDTMKQERVKISELLSLLQAKIG